MSNFKNDKNNNYAQSSQIEQPTGFGAELASNYLEKNPLGSILPKEKKPLSAATNKFLIEGAPSEKMRKALYKAAKNMRECGFSLMEIFDFISAKNVPGVDLLNLNTQRVINAAFNNKPLNENSNAEKADALKNTLENLCESLTGKVLIYQDATGSETYLWHKSPTIVERLSFDGFKVKVAEILGQNGVIMLHKNLVELVKTFAVSPFSAPLKIFKLPPPFSRDPKEITFRYLDLPLDASMPTPTWDFFIEHCGLNGRALMAYTWSVFEQVELRQYLLLSSAGKSGKSSYCEWLQGLIGDESTCSLSPKNPHWPSMCVGKRLGIWPELNQTSFVQSAEFKAVTGNDFVSINQKYEKSYNTKLDIRFILSTNSSIDIEGRVSESTRCILVDMRQPNQYINDYKAKLKAETAGFLFKCKQAFDELYSDNVIKADNSDFEMHSTTFEDDFNLLFEKAFKVVEGEKLRTISFTNAIEAVSTKYNKFEKQNFKQWVLRTKNIQMIKSNGHYYFVNLTLSDSIKSSALILKLVP